MEYQGVVNTKDTKCFHEETRSDYFPTNYSLYSFVINVHEALAKK